MTTTDPVPITPDALRHLEFAAAHQAAAGRPPTLADAIAGAGLSRQVAARTRLELWAAGYLRREPAQGGSRYVVVAGALAAARSAGTRRPYRRAPRYDRAPILAAARELVADGVWPARAAVAEAAGCGEDAAARALREAAAAGSWSWAAVRAAGLHRNTRLLELRRIARARRAKAAAGGPSGWRARKADAGRVREFRYVGA